MISIKIHFSEIFLSSDTETILRMTDVNSVCMYGELLI